ncbi:MAG: LLM class F420-dependent oxidoreductase [Propionibacteriales bacterium]|nr:LLM class F420-dependent oxidoreductase [Propionibacteriales bacterium]
MRIGVHLIKFDNQGGSAAIGPAVAAFGRAADDAGIDNLSCMDHYFQLGMIGPPDLAMLEGYTTLGFLAGVTERVELQLLVTGVTYRHPGLLAKIVTTLDVLSGGRAVLGIGAAWNAEEHRGLGVPFPPVAERFERLEETLQIVRQMWRGDETPYEGTHYRLERPLNAPPPVRVPPIMVGGGGEQKTLRLVARYADACNLFANPQDGPAGVAHKLDVLRGHCEREGTDYEAIRKTILWSNPLEPDTDASTFVEHLRPLADLGVTEVHLMPFGDDPVAFVRALGDHVVGPVHAIG